MSETIQKHGECKYTYYQSTHTIVKTPTHYKTHTYTHPHITKPTHTHNHILQKKVKTSIVQDTHQTK